ncbi:DUF6933 domain-containing protein [Zobellella aerophila]|uniref:DUF6933 domain-containing protein n=1 Tax=Zobellella aerophila TaxID=870480 RepID=A0ABP6V6B1_9GAMM
MLIFNCTKAAAQLFSCIRKGVNRSPVEAPPGPLFAEDHRRLTNHHGQQPHLSQWLVHAIKVQGQNCLIAMELNSRYCMTFTGLRKGDSETFVSLFIERLLKAMFCHWLSEYCGASPLQVEQAATRFRALRLHGGEPPPGLKMREIAAADTPNMPDKVVSLAAFRQDKE